MVVSLPVARELGEDYAGSHPLPSDRSRPAVVPVSPVPQRSAQPDESPHTATAEQPFASKRPHQARMAQPFGSKPPHAAKVAAYVAQPARRSVKSLPTARDYRDKRKEKLHKIRSAARDEVVARTRTEQYLVDPTGQFNGSYHRVDGTQVFVRGSVIGQVRWEKAPAVDQFWMKVTYRAPR